jgi:L-alanine-DL-glutamate epimerase-like enolase superfamily enzyme
MRWSIEKIILELKYTWKISRNASNTKTNLVVKVTDGPYQGIGESAPNIRYQETPDELIAQFDSFLFSRPEAINSLPQLTDHLNRTPMAKALRFAVESAFVHYLASRDHTTVFNILNIEQPSSMCTSYSIPIMDIGKMNDFYRDNRLSRFPFIKIKIDAESGLDTIQYLGRICSQPMIVDANEAYTDVEACIYFFEKISKLKIEFMEQPMPASMTDESRYLKKYAPFSLFADESITSEADFSQLKTMFDGVNIKLMKAGGYFNGIRLLKEAKKANMQTMVGCMVETTCGISSAMNLCSLADYVDLDSFLLVKDEPYQLVNEREGELFFKNAEE